MRDRAGRIRIYLALLLGCASHAAVAQVWENDWTANFAPLPLDNFTDNAGVPLQGPIAITADGGVIARTGSQQYAGDQIVRLDAAGNVRWRVNLGTTGSSYAELEAILPRADGGAFVALSAAAAVASIDPAGNVGWVTSADARYLALDGGALIVQGCDRLQALDAATGQLLWDRVFSDPANCAAGGVAVDADGALYAGFAGQNGFVGKYGADGTLLWQTHDAPVRVVGIGDGLAYVSWFLATYSPATTVALHAADGTVAWSSSNGVALGLAGSPAEVIVDSGSTLQRLSAQDGAPRWSANTNSNLRFSSPPPAYAYSTGSANKFVAGGTQVDADTGAIDWTAATPGSDETVAIGRRNGDIVYGEIPFSAGAVVLRDVDAASGATLSTSSVPSAPQALPGFTLGMTPQTVYQLAQYVVGQDFTFGVRALDRGSGALGWQATLSPQPVQQEVQTWTGSALTQDAAVLTFTANTGSSAYAVGAVWVGAVDLSNGATRWTKLLQQSDATRIQGLTASYSPVADADGNVLVGYSASYTLQQPPPGGSPYEYVVSVAKLSAADGSLIWRHDETFASYYPGAGVYPPAVFTVGNDVYVAGPFAAPHATDSLAKLSGVDGSVLWWTNAYYDQNSVNGSISGVHAAADGNVIVDGFGGWGEIDAQTGATIWSNTRVYSCVNRCLNGGGEVTLPNGDTYSGAQSASRAQLVLLPGSAGASIQDFALDASDAVAADSYANTVNLGADGSLWTSIRRNYRYSQRTMYLAQFDPVSKTVLRQQALYLGGRSVLLDYDGAVPQAAPQNERLVVDTYARNPPQQPTTLGSALLDTSVTATGNLALQFTTDKAMASVGKPVDFHLHVTYSGDAPISGARLLADFPWLGHATGVACAVQAASNCLLDLRTDTLVASFDMQSGGSVDITGRMTTTDGADAGLLSAVVAGPLALNELDTSDNAAQAIVNQSLFADGFE